MKIFFVCFVTLVASAYAGDDETALTPVLKDNALTKVLDSVGEVTPTGDVKLEDLETTINELFSNSEKKNVVVSSLIRSAVATLNTVTKDLQNLVTTASNTATGALETVKSEVNRFIGTMSDQGDKLLAEIADAAGVNLDKGVAPCVTAAKSEGVKTVQDLVSKSIDCPIKIIESISSKITELMGTPASAANLAENAVKELTACKTNSNILSKATCVTKAAASVQQQTASLVLKTAILVSSTTSVVATIRETIIICVTTNMGPAAWNVANIIAKIGACSATSVISG